MSRSVSVLFSDGRLQIGAVTHPLRPRPEWPALHGGGAQRADAASIPSRSCTGGGRGFTSYEARECVGRRGGSHRTLGSHCCPHSSDPVRLRQITKQGRARTIRTNVVCYNRSFRSLPAGFRTSADLVTFWMLRVLVLTASMPVRPPAAPERRAGSRERRQRRASSPHEQIALSADGMALRRCAPDSTTPALEPLFQCRRTRPHPGSTRDR